jgi:hypothetical protein
MKKTATKRQTVLRGIPALIGVITALAIGGLAAILCSADSTAVAAPPQTNAVPVQTNTVVLKASLPETNQVAVKIQLTGAELYSIHCNRCHQERYPTERTGAQWKTIMLHMQVRANIPVEQAKLILQYLQDNSGR